MTTTRRARISHSTRAMIERLREAQTDQYWTYAMARHPLAYRAAYCDGLREAVKVALIYETPWSLNDIATYIDKQLAKPEA